MAIKKRLLVCDCGEQFEEGKDGLPVGNLTCGPWKYKQAKVRPGAAPSDGDAVIIYFVRSIDCNKCMSELHRDKKAYEVSPGQSKVEKPDGIKQETKSEERA
jgi:hypothetical protein